MKSGVVRLSQNPGNITFLVGQTNYLVCKPIITGPLNQLTPELLSSFKHNKTSCVLHILQSNEHCGCMFCLKLPSSQNTFQIDLQYNITTSYDTDVFLTLCVCMKCVHNQSKSNNINAIFIFYFSTTTKNNVCYWYLYIPDLQLYLIHSSAPE